MGERYWNDITTPLLDIFESVGFLQPAYFNLLALELRDHSSREDFNALFWLRPEWFTEC